MMLDAHFHKQVQMANSDAFLLSYLGSETQKGELKAKLLLPLPMCNRNRIVEIQMS